MAGFGVVGYVGAGQVEHPVASQSALADKRYPSPTTANAKTRYAEVVEVRRQLSRLIVGPVVGRFSQLLTEQAKVRNQTCETVLQVRVNEFLAGKSEGTGWGILVALLREFASQLVVLDSGLLNSDDRLSSLGANSGGELLVHAEEWT